mmetsp:Transcript_18479/g.50825  ORF Transcript_18479/g.50825 Transcript_18479/m.50825 type:complete len:352 (+) Transcript_18479:1394-2449(+)
MGRHDAAARGRGGSEPIGLQPDLAYVFGTVVQQLFSCAPPPDVGAGRDLAESFHPLTELLAPRAEPVRGQSVDPRHKLSQLLHPRLVELRVAGALPGLDKPIASLREPWGRQAHFSEELAGRRGPLLVDWVSRGSLGPAVQRHRGRLDARGGHPVGEHLALAAPLLDHDLAAIQTCPTWQHRRDELGEPALLLLDAAEAPDKPRRRQPDQLRLRLSRRCRQLRIDLLGRDALRVGAGVPGGLRRVVRCSGLGAGPVLRCWRAVSSHSRANVAPRGLPPPCRGRRGAVGRGGSDRGFGSGRHRQRRRCDRFVRPSGLPDGRDAVAARLTHGPLAPARGAGGTAVAKLSAAGA